MTLANLGNGRKGRRRRSGGILSMLSGNSRKGKRSPMDKLGGRSKKGRTALADQFDGGKKRRSSRAGGIVATFVGALASGGFSNPVERIRSDYDQRDARYDNRRYGPVVGQDAQGNEIRAWQHASWWDLAWQRFTGGNQEDMQNASAARQANALMDEYEDANAPLANPAPSQSLLGSMAQFFRDRGWIR